MVSISLIVLFLKRDLANVYTYGDLQPDTYWKNSDTGRCIRLLGPCAVPDGVDNGLYVEIEDMESTRLGYIKADDFLYYYHRVDAPPL